MHLQLCRNARIPSALGNMVLQYYSFSMGRKSDRSEILALASFDKPSGGSFISYHHISVTFSGALRWRSVGNGTN